MPFKGYYLSPEGDLKRELAAEEIKAAFESGQGLLWVDIAETTEEDSKFLAQTFKDHEIGDVHGGHLVDVKDRQSSSKVFRQSGGDSYCAFGQR